MINLYKAGDQCVDVTGGWDSHIFLPESKTLDTHPTSVVFNDTDVTLTATDEPAYSFNDDGELVPLSYRSEAFMVTKNPIDLTNINSITLVSTNDDAEHGLSLQVVKGADSAPADAIAFNSQSKDSKIITLDVSYLKCEAYVRVRLYGVGGYSVDEENQTVTNSKCTGSASIFEIHMAASNTVYGMGMNG